MTLNLGKPWLTSDETAIVAMLGDGHNYASIATSLGRSKQTVKDRAWRLLGRSTTAQDFKPFPRRTIAKADLPSFYEVGWSVVSFSGDCIEMEWRWGGQAHVPA